MGILTFRKLRFPADREAVINIWNAAFPEDGEYVTHFLDTIGAETVGYCAQMHHQPIAMLFLLSGTLYVKHKPLSAQYVYAVATLPSYRGRGIASQLLAYCKTQVKTDVLYLHPATQSLVSLYSRCGFTHCLYKTSALVEDCGVKRTNFTDNTALYEQKRIQFCTADVYSTFDSCLYALLPSNVQLLYFENGAAVIHCNAQSSVILEAFAANMPTKTEADVAVMVMLISDCAKKCFDKTVQTFSGLYFDV